MKLSLVPEQRPEQRIRIVTLNEVLSLGRLFQKDHPPLEHYFSPSRKEKFVRDYIHYLNSKLLEAKHGKLNTDLYLMFVLSFQFTSPMLEIMAEEELGLFYRILENTYDIEEPDLNLYFTTDVFDKGMIGEEEALLSYRQELKESYEGSRKVKERVQSRLKEDGIEAVMKWQQDKDLPSLAEAFGRSIVIPSFFSFTDKKLVRFYRCATEGISYEVAIPEEIK
ncbi:MAG: hypothetical protein JXA39_06380 [Bacteroidales bacterium]|nr:hypothetical protein [Bacteroidales bacterium]